MDGTFKLTLDGGYTPTGGETFQFLKTSNNGSIVGTFASFDTSLATLLPGLSWNFSNLYSTGFADIVGVAVPEPAAVAAIFGVLALGFAAVRRRAKSKGNARDENR